MYHLPSSVHMRILSTALIRLDRLEWFTLAATLFTNLNIYKLEKILKFKVSIKEVLLDGIFCLPQSSPNYCFVFASVLLREELPYHELLKSWHCQKRDIKQGASVRFLIFFLPSRPSLERASPKVNQKVSSATLVQSPV